MLLFLLALVGLRLASREMEENYTLSCWQWHSNKLGRGENEENA